MKKMLTSFSLFEKGLWLVSVAVIIASSLLCQCGIGMSVIASLIGVTALIFIAKGHYIGQLLVMVFAVFYGILSVQQKYYGEAFTYLGMTLPTAFITMIVWIRHPYQDSKTVAVAGKLGMKKGIGLIAAAVVVTVGSYFVLRALGNAQLLVSTLSVATSFFAAGLMFFRSPYYAIAYAANDVVLVVLWVMASFHDRSSIPVVACFVMFLFNDCYGYYSWKKMKKYQHQQTKKQRSE